MAADLGLPLDLLFVRHGESEGNVVAHMLRAGDTSGSQALLEARRHDSDVRLTDFGREQARAVGAWIRENVGCLDKHFVSQYTRTKETAGEMGLPNAQWTLDVTIRERDQGVNEGKGAARMGLDEGERERLGRSQMYWAPIAGESIADVFTRVRLFLDRLRREACGMRVVIVCHHQVMQAFRLLIEDKPQHEFESQLSQNLPNCCVLWYTRRDAQGDVRSRISGLKIVTVGVRGAETKVESVEVSRRMFTNEELLQQINAEVPQLVNNDGVAAKRQKIA